MKMKMKMKNKDYLDLKMILKKTIKENQKCLETYFTCHNKKQYRWDLLWVCDYDIRPLHKYLNDSHIDTALKSIMHPYLAIYK